MLPRTKEEVLEEIIGWVDLLNEENGRAVIIVEGIKDKKALEAIGVDLRIVHLNKGMSIITFLEQLKRGERPFEELGPFNRVVVLTDWDRTGGRLASKLKEACRNLEMDCDLDRRRDLARITSKWVRDVESLDSLFR
ncbi:MAG: toprim domain-containing protein [Thermoplasmatota archaeon]